MSKRFSTRKNARAGALKPKMDDQLTFPDKPVKDWKRTKPTKPAIPTIPTYMKKVCKSTGSLGSIKVMVLLKKTEV